ncbi:MAG: ABC transporter ATP-binding protein [Burkholderiaceae bacterium]
MSLRRLVTSVAAPQTSAIAGSLRLDGLTKRFGAKPAIHELNLEVAEGELLAITGPSGAGKSTLGRLVSGLEQATTGRILVGSHDLTQLPARGRRVSHMFESFALYPTRTVFSNIASPLNAPTSQGRWTTAQTQERVEEVLALTEMTPYRDRFPSQLSGGQKQRVALCRALVQDPSVFVLDEPIGHLDAKLRHRLRGEIRRRQAKLGQPTVWLSPDGLEAMAVADRLAVLIEGRLQQVDDPETVFNRPNNVKVARLIGDPAMNVVDISIVDGPAGVLRVGDGDPIKPARPLFDRLASAAIEAHLTLGIRPTSLRIRERGGSDGAIMAEIYAVEPLGKVTIVTVQIGSCRLRAKMSASTQFAIGAPVEIDFAPSEALLFHPNTGDLMGS